MPLKLLIPLTEVDVSQFVSQEANFAFEMAALSAVRDAGFDAEHAASYKDPVTGKLRAFDIRARWSGDSRSLRFAVECKNLRAHAPLLVHATPRTAQEATHNVVARYKISTSFFQDVLPHQGVYQPGDFVGRQTDQPMKDATGDFKSQDAETYDKWIQTVNGCQDLVRELVNAPFGKPELCAVVPILAVPDGMLWQVDYDERGAVVAPARKVESSTLILRQYWSADSLYKPIHYGLSHVEILTLSKLGARMGELCSPAGMCAGASDQLAKLGG